MLCMNIAWQNRLFEKRYSNFNVTVDGIYCKTFEPATFSSDWHGHKSHSPDVRYEVSVTIKSGLIVRAIGSFPCGLYPDQKILILR